MNTTGRDACPCGSGKKYKQCCMQQGAAPVVAQTAAILAIQSLLQTAVAHIQAGRLPEAETLCRQVLQQQPNQPDALQLVLALAKAWFQVATLQNEQGNYADAIASYRRSLALAPRHAAAHNNLGNALGAQDKLNEAAESYRQALLLRPDYAEAHRNLAGVFRSMGKLDAAIAHCHLAINHKPGYIKAYETLANVHIDQGQFDAARDVISSILQMDPDHARAWGMLVKLRKMTLEDDDWLQTALRLVSQEREGAAGGAIALWYAIGKYYDDTRQYDAAFAAYRQANELKRQQGGSFGRDALLRLVDALKATYTHDYIRQRHEGASLSERPVLIVGMPRSGTSLVEQIIASHPDTFGAGEQIFWTNQSNDHLGIELSGRYEPAFVSSLAAGYEQLLREYSATASRVVDKMPGNFWRLGMIMTVFPHARIVHTRRNPIDTCLSMYFQNFDRTHAYGTDLGDLTFYYREYLRLMAHWRSVLPPERFLEVPYEALTADQEGWSRRIIEFLGLEWNDRCLEFHKTERKVGTASNWQVRQKIYQTSKERWRNYEKHLGPLLGLLEEPVGSAE